MIRRNSILGRENRTTVTDCQADYGTPADAAQRTVEQTEQRGQTRASAQGGPVTRRGRFF